MTTCNCHGGPNCCMFQHQRAFTPTSPLPPVDWKFYDDVPIVLSLSGWLLLVALLVEKGKLANLGVMGEET